MATALRTFLLLLAPAVLFADGGVVSLRPLYTPETAVLKPAFADLWSDNGQMFTITFRLEPDGETGYDVWLGRTRIAELHLVELGGETIGDLVFESADPFQAVSIHHLLRLRIDGNTLHVDWLDVDALARHVERSGLAGFERVRGRGDDDVFIFTGSTAELRQFVLDCLKRPDAFGDGNTYKRADPARRAADLNERSWECVRSSPNSEQIAMALKDAEEAVSLMPDNPDYRLTLGAAQYRAQDFSASLASVTRAALLRKVDSVADLAFRAMAHHQLGEVGEAARLLGELRKLILDSQCPDDQDTLRLYREAAGLIAPKRK